MLSKICTFLLKKKLFPEMWSLSTAISAGSLAVFGFVLSFWKELKVKLEIHLNGL